MMLVQIGVINERSMIEKSLQLATSEVRLATCAVLKHRSIYRCLRTIGHQFSSNNKIAYRGLFAQIRVVFRRERVEEVWLAAQACECLVAKSFVCLMLLE